METSIRRGAFAVLALSAVALTAGAEEQVLPELTDAVVRGDLRHAELRAPQQPGGYRLFAYVRNGAGAAVANVPFHVAGETKPAAKP